MTRVVARSLIALVLCTFAIPARAQTTTATVRGTVTDSSGAVLPGVTVTLTNADTGLVRVNTTNALGEYVVPSLPAGPYTIAVELAGFQTVRREGLRFEVGQEATLPSVTLALAGVEQTVVVRAETPLVETTKTTVDRVVTRDEIDTLPLAGRRAGSLAVLAPGVVPRESGVDSGNDPVVSGGQPRGSGEILVDGVTNKAMSVNGLRGNTPPDTIQEFQVLTTQYAAEFGNASGVVLNTITRSGTNTLQGRVYYFHRDAALDARSPLSTTKASFEQKQGGGWLGGPIVKNRTHFFVAYEATDQQAYATVTSPVQPGDVSQPFTNNELLAKLTHQLTPNNLLVARYSLDRPHTLNAMAGGIYLEDVGLDALTVDQALVTNLTSVVSSHALNEVRFQLANTSNAYLPANPDAYTIIRPSSWSGKMPTYPQEYNERRYQFVDNFTYDLVRHRFKVGMDVNRVSMDGSVQFTPGVYQFTTDQPYDAKDPATYPLLFLKTVADPNFSVVLNSVSLFAQDAWQLLNNLTINYGVRYDAMTMTYLDLRKTNVAPRIGFAWDPFGTKRTSIRGGFGVFYNSAMGNAALLAGTLGNARQEITLYPSYPDPTVGGGIAYPQPSNSYLAEPNQRLPRSDNFTVGIQRELKTGLSVNADFVDARGRDLMRVVETNPTLPSLQRQDPTKGSRRLIQSSGYGDYQALMLGTTWRASASAAFGASYTLSRSKTTNESEYAVFYQNDLTPNDSYGYSDYDQRHRLVLNGSVMLPWQIQLGALLIARSGLPFNVTTGTDNNQNGEMNDRPNLAPGAKENTADMLKRSSFLDPGTASGDLSRNAGRGPSSWQLDVRVSKAFTIGHTRLELLAEAFNLGNRANLGAPVGNLSSSLFGQSVTLAGNPRQVQLGVRFDF